jgi:hypothetical protein
MNTHNFKIFVEALEALPDDIKNCICGVMVRLLVLDVLDHGSCSSQIKDYQIDICCGGWGSSR